MLFDCSIESGPYTHRFFLIYIDSIFILFLLRPKFSSLYGLPSRLLSKNLKIKIYKTIVLPVVLYGSETRSLTLREDPEANIWAQEGLEW